MLVELLRENIISEYVKSNMKIVFALNATTLSEEYFSCTRIVGKMVPLLSCL